MQNSVTVERPAYISRKFTFFKEGTKNDKKPGIVTGSRGMMIQETREDVIPLSKLNNFTVVPPRIGVTTK